MLLLVCLFIPPDDLPLRALAPPPSRKSRLTNISMINNISKISITNSITIIISSSSKRVVVLALSLKSEPPTPTSMPFRARAHVVKSQRPVEE